MFRLLSETVEPLYESGDVKVVHRHDASAGDLAEVFNNLREADKFELACLEHTPQDAMQLALFASHSYVVRKAEEPVFVGGVHQIFPHCFMTFGFGTEETPKIIRPVTRYIRNHWLPKMFDEGAARFEVRVPTRSPSLRWLEAIGFSRETALPGYAVNGEPHLQLSITRPRVHVCFRKDADHSGRASEGRAGSGESFASQPG